MNPISHDATTATAPIADEAKEQVHRGGLLPVFDSEGRAMPRIRCWGPGLELKNKFCETNPPQLHPKQLPGAIHRRDEKKDAACTVTKTNHQSRLGDPARLESITPSADRPKSRSSISPWAFVVNNKRKHV